MTVKNNDGDPAEVTALQNGQGIPLKIQSNHQKITTVQLIKHNQPQNSIVA